MKPANTGILCACGCGGKVKPSRKTKPSLYLRGHSPGSARNLKRDAPSEATQAAHIAALKESPLLQKNSGHINARHWRLRSPCNTIHTFINLREFVRANEHLFAPEDVEWKSTAKGDLDCRACNGLAALSPRNISNPRGSWKGWTWQSQTERLFHDGKDLIDRPDNSAPPPSDKEVINAAHKIRLDIALITLAEWCLQRAATDHAPGTTLTMLEKKANAIRAKVLKAGWRAIAKE